MQLVFLILEILGTVTFACSGAIVGIKKHNDIFGVCFLGVTTAVGGGIIRDVCIGNVPPLIFTNYIFVVIAILSSIIVFVSLFISKKKFSKKRFRLDGVITLFDAIGLGVFTINGMNVLLLNEIEHNAYLVIFVGLATGIGGGMIRDVLVNDVPFILHEKIYAVAALIGGLLYYCLFIYAPIHYIISMIFSILIIIAIRLITSHLKIHLPKISNNK